MTSAIVFDCPMAICTIQVCHVFIYFRMAVFGFNFTLSVCITKSVLKQRVVDDELDKMNMVIRLTKYEGAPFGKMFVLSLRFLVN